jgi:hypothetical protein
MHYRTFWCLVVGQYARVTQCRAQRHGELTAKLHQLFAFVGICNFNAQIATLLHHALQHANNRRNAIFRREVFQKLTRDKHLAGKNQRGERQVANQFFCIICLVAFKNDIARILFHTGKTKHFAFRGFISDLRGTLFFKARATI